MIRPYQFLFLSEFKFFEFQDELKNNSAFINFITKK